MSDSPPKICNRHDGRKWRCGRPAFEGRSLCEKHYLQGKLRQHKESVPDDLKFERQRYRKNHENESNVSKKGKRKVLDDSEDDPVEITQKGPRKKSKKSKKAKSSSKSSADMSEDLDDLIRGYLNRQVEKKKGKQPRKEDIVKELKYGRLEISQTSPSTPPIPVTNVKVGAPAPAPSSAPTRFFRSKNIDRVPVATMQYSISDFGEYSSFSASSKACMDKLRGPDGQLPQKLRTLQPLHIEQISNEIMDKATDVGWDDIAGLHHVKECVSEMAIWPLLRPDIFKGCRSPGRGLLLFGPPGTGKTMIGKAIAGEAKATFFYVSASSLTGRYWGDAEKLVRALFGVASCRQPAVIFFDEIDSLLSKRTSGGNEKENSRRLKTQLLIEMEGFNNGTDQILVIGATNRPQDLDEAARRRLTKRFYIPLPSSEARAYIVRNLLKKDGLFKLSKKDIDRICKLTEGYSGLDMTNLVKDASMGPVREALRQGIKITKLKQEEMRPVSLQDFEKSLEEVRPSVSSYELATYEDWNNKFGTLSTSSMYC